MFSMEVTQLIERCRQGDADALGELYKAYAQRMRGVCRRYISDEQAISDVLHDAFVIIFTSFDKLRDDRKAEAWMMSITRNVASKYKDHLTKTTFVQLDEAVHLQMSEGERDVRGIPLEDVMQLVDRLPEGYGRVFRLSVFEGMTHKEIAEMLGIEPHSSSSQLARAKKMLRKMMRQYWVAVLLLLMPLAYLLLQKGETAITNNGKPVVAKQTESKDGQQSLHGESPMEQPQEPVIVHVPVHRTAVIASDTLQPVVAQTVDSVTSDTLFNTLVQDQEGSDSIVADTIKAIPEVKLPHYDIADVFPPKPLIGTRHQQRWSIVLAYAGGMGELNVSRPYSFMGTPTLAPTGGEPPSPVSFENWSDYAAFLADNPDGVSSQTRSVIMNIALNNASDAAGLSTDKIVRKSRHYMPVTFSLALKYRLTSRFGLETGLGYSRLKSEFGMGSNGNVISEQQTIHYLGIPLKCSYNIYNVRQWSLYGCLGAKLEIPVYAPISTSYFVNSMKELEEKSTLRAPWQWSVGTGLGLQYNITPNIGLFAEPSLQYHIPTGSQIETYHTDHPFTFSLPIGIRLTWPVKGKK